VIDVPTERRSKLDLYFEILQAINMGNGRVTRIMREVNMGYKPLKEMLDSLQRQDIVEVLDAVHFKDKRTSVYYKLTRKGGNIYRYLRTALNNVNDTPSSTPL
jgi:predicted transcriptional regulator